MGFGRVFLHKQKKTVPITQKFKGKREKSNAEREYSMWHDISLFQVPAMILYSLKLVTTRSTRT